LQEPPLDLGLVQVRDLNRDRKSPDLTGDGRPDLLAIQQTKLFLYPGTADPRRAPIDRKPRLTLDLPATEAVSIDSSAGTG
jgi:hypothetical protein